jgi:DNA segregation ATPase FtsK/SpoIIIE-like protein
MEIGTKTILDVCCGSRMFWFNKKHPDALYLDIRDLLQNPPENTVNVMKMMDAPAIAAIDDANAFQDPLFEKLKSSLADPVYKGANINARYISLNFSVSYGRASALIDQLEAAGIISAPDPKTHRRHVL